MPRLNGPNDNKRRKFIWLGSLHKKPKYMWLEMKETNLDMKSMRGAALVWICCGIVWQVSFGFRLPESAARCVRTRRSRRLRSPQQLGGRQPRSSSGLQPRVLHSHVCPIHRSPQQPTTILQRTSRRRPWQINYQTPTPHPKQKHLCVMLLTLSTPTFSEECHETRLKGKRNPKWLIFVKFQFGNKRLYYYYYCYHCYDDYCYY